MKVNLEKAKQKLQVYNYEGYLEQKMGSIFSSWKKHYYICLEGIAFI